MAFKTKLNLSDEKFIQLSGDTINLSGNTGMYGVIALKDVSGFTEIKEIFTVEGITGGSITNVVQYREFGEGIDATNVIYGVAYDYDNNKIIIGGDFVTINGISRTYLGAYNSNGLLDLNYGALGTDNQVNAVAYEAIQQRHFFGGVFSQVYFKDGSTINADRLIKLFPNGDHDSSFTSYGFDGDVLTLYVDDLNQKLYVGGNFSQYSGYTSAGLVRLNYDGTIDYTFGVDSGFDGDVRGVYYDSNNNKIFVVGAFSTFTGDTVNGIVKLNYDGTRDLTFSGGTGFNVAAEIRSITVMGGVSDYFVVCGEFNEYNGDTNAAGAAKISFDGILDTGFTANFGASAAVFVPGGVKGSANEVWVYGLLIVPPFNKVNVVRVDEFGNFLYSTGVGGIVTNMVLDGNNDPIIVGQFNAYNYNNVAQIKTSRGIARLAASTGEIQSFVNVITSKGVVYDYTGVTENLMTSGSLISKSYVDGRIEGVVQMIPTDIVVDGANGLTKIGNNLVLGGDLTGFTQINGNGNSLSLGYVFNPLQDFSVYSQSGITLSTSNGGGIIFDAFNLIATLNVPTSGITIIGADANFRGLEYATDNSVNYSARSLVDKGYVDTIIASSGASASNGLSKLGSNIVLGGSLTGSTIVDVNSNTLTLSGLSSSTILIENRSDGDYVGHDYVNTITVEPYNIRLETYSGATNASTLTINDLGFTFYGINLSSGRRHRLTGNDGLIRMEGVDNTNTTRTSFRISPTVATFFDSRTGTTAVGLTYAANYSANFNNRSLVDKGYVTGLTSQNSKSSFSITGNNVTTTFTVTHNKNTRDIIVQVYESASPHGTILVDVERVSVNAVEVKFNTAPGTGIQYRVVII